MSEKTILVTGFGPFGDHSVNASWEAVKKLEEKREYLREKHNIKLVTKEIPVVYDHVVQEVSRLWEEHDPQIVVHVGVSPHAKCLTIERRAHGSGYITKDVHGKCAPGECGNESSLSPAFLETDIDVLDLCWKINNSNKEKLCKACTSENAGRYLCEYIYYHSLCKNPSRSLFVHVPTDSVYSAEVSAKGLCEMIELLIKRI